MPSHSESHTSPLQEPPALSRRGRYLVLLAAFSGWMLAGLEMNIGPLAGRTIIKALLAQNGPGSSVPRPVPDGSTGSPAFPTSSLDLETATLPGSSPLSSEAEVARWFSWLICAFLLGAAAGGPLFGWMGDRIGRSRAMAASILCFSLFTGMTYFVESLQVLLVLRFLACLGVGGMWPTGVALVSEAWSEASRPLLAGLIGTAANVGFVLLAAIGNLRHITETDWRWVMLVGATPALLGVFVLITVPESPLWLARRGKGVRNQSRESPAGPSRQLVPASLSSPRSPLAIVFRPPYLGCTILGILLGTVPLLGGWGAQNWLIPWADQAGEQTGDSGLKAVTSMWRSSGAALGSLLGGGLAALFGRRTTYFAISLASLVISGYIFRALDPTDPSFQTWVFAIGFVGTIYFGWLPLYLPELFPTSVRATGTGVTFNFGRIASAATLLAAGALMDLYSRDYGRIGSVTSLIYFAGMIVILFAPDTSRRRMSDDT